MTSAVMHLLELFQDKGAFIFVQRKEKGPPIFHIVSCNDIMDSGTVGGRDPCCNVLIVTECIYEDPELVKRTVSSLAYDWAVDTVCAQSVKLAKQLAEDAITEFWLPYEMESMVLGRLD